MANDFLELEARLDDQGVVSGLNAIDRAQKNVAKSGIVLTDQWGNIDKALTRSRASLVQTEQASKRVTQTLSQMFAGTGGTAPSGAAAGLTRAVGALGGAFGITALTGAGAAYAVANITREAIASASRISDLAARTDLSTDAVQRLGFVAEQTGTSVEAMASSAFRLGVRLSSGGSSVTRAIQDLGLSFQQIRNLNPEAQFDTVARALSKVTDTQQRNRIGVQLFGRQYEQIAPAIKDYRKLVDEASVASAENIAALDRLGDRIVGFASRVKAAAIDATGSVVRLAEEAAKLPGNVAGAAGAVRGGALNSIFRLGQGGIPSGGASPVAKQASDFVAELDKVRKELDAKLTPATVAQIRAFMELGATTDDVMQEFHLGEKEVLLLSGRLDELKKKTDDATAAAKKHAQTLEDAFKDIHRLVTTSDVGDILKLGGIDLGRQLRPPPSPGLTIGQPDLSDITASVMAYERAVMKSLTATVTWRESLADITAQFLLLAQIGGQSFSQVLRGIGSLLAAVQTTDKAIQQLRTSTTALGSLSSGLGLATLPLTIGSFFKDDPVIAQVRALEAEAEKLGLTVQKMHSVFNKGGKSAWVQQAEDLQRMIDGLHGAEDATKRLADAQATLQGIIRDANFAADQAGRTGIDAVLAELAYQREREIDALAQYAAVDAAMYAQAVEAVTRKYTALADRAIRDEADRMAKETASAVDELTRVSTLLDTIKKHTDTEIASLGQFSSAGEFYRAVVGKIQGRQMQAELSALRRAGNAASTGAPGIASIPVSIDKLIIGAEMDDPFLAQRIGEAILADVARKGQRVS